MPETIRAGSDSTSPSAAKRTQSTGVPSVAKPVVPSANSTSSTQSGLPVVMLRAVALRFESGAITASSTPGTSSRARRMAFRPIAWMPSSLVRRTFTVSEDSRGTGVSPRRIQPRSGGSRRPPASVTDRLQVQAVRGHGFPCLLARPTGQQLAILLEAHPPARHCQHRAHERPHHVAHEGVRRDPEGDHLVRLVEPLRAHDVADEANVVSLGRREGGEVVASAKACRTGLESGSGERSRPVEGAAALERASHPPRQHAVAVGATPRVPAGVEALRRRLAREYADVLRQHAVERVDGQRLAGVARHLAAGVDAGVRPARHRDRRRLAGDRPDRVLEGRLYGAKAGLSRPAGEVAAVVLEQQPRAHPRLRATLSRYSLLTRADPSCASLKRRVSSFSSSIMASYCSGDSAPLAATVGGELPASRPASASGDAPSCTSSRRSHSTEVAKPAKRSRTVSSTPHSSLSGMSGGGGVNLRPMAISSALKPPCIHAVMPTLPPGRTTRKSSAAATSGRGAIMAPKTEPTQSKRTSSKGSSSTSAWTHSIS